MNVAKTLGLVIKKYIQERNPITEINMENLSGVYPLLEIRKLTVKRNSTGVMTVGKLL